MRSAAALPLLVHHKTGSKFFLGRGRSDQAFFEWSLTNRIGGGLVSLGLPGANCGAFLQRIEVLL